VQATHYRQNALIARIVGVLTIALGFVSGLYGLDHAGSSWLPTALGLLTTGIVAQGYALYCSIKRASLEGAQGSPDRQSGRHQPKE
jgi:hypothetical protein